jgi:hypothetical protein
MSSIPNTEEKLAPSYIPGHHTAETPSTQNVIAKLGLEKHIEGGYFTEIDRDPLTIPNPFPASRSNTQTAEKVHIYNTYITLPPSHTPSMMLMVSSRFLEMIRSEMRARVYITS